MPPDQRGSVQGLLIFLGLAALVLLLPVLLPVVAVLVALDRRRRVRTAEAFGCTRCEQTIGREGLACGDAAWSEHFAALRRKYPHSKLRVVRDVYAVCPRCGARYGYDKDARTFRLLPDPAPV